MLKVAILSHAHASLFELACAVELFALPRPEFKNWYQTDVINLENQTFESTGGVLIQTQYVTSIQDYDVLVVPSWPVKPMSIPVMIAQQVLQFVHSGKRVITFCSGAFLLAELGILDGKQATTHWAFAQDFQARFPKVNYAADVLYVFDGHIGCSAGSAAGLDLGLAVIRRDFGYQVANQVAKRLVVSAHRSGGQSQFVDSPMLAVPNQFSQALHWAQKNIDQAINIETMAAKANMSRRTFDRKFRASFNLSPKAWLIQQRIERAKGLLETESVNMETLAQLAGFDNATTLRHHFRRLIGVSPKQYRQQFSG
ncbi:MULTISPECIES: helix-turn-helix domain-containing protein [Vibrio]|uniref:Helix-turn-helix domain-containing protein n=1 Tax=Vibrio aestuarianus TaxID=28171 RepID=A0A9X4FB43_9VIBR|nr:MULTISPECIES: helix-turn-helix domain-containing protein [Vibrio]KOE88468.1 transcriptional regulator [Vibrio alginolyticus]MDE1229802.1 helix-turn-helix domain-containing protein [Vibrio aestuarianus]MDE1236527.1 helix-turn-helix domain-containing protein [Vibrio aestuarianus]MDE1247420.1 helix-turn-helix domain-containing protein [Vibrio aestuarianus]MDE1258413.1 helix-turn-helix domain-containing protein [Vibrio aestuarianus]